MTELTTEAGKRHLDDLAPIEAWKDRVIRATQQSVRDSFAEDIAAIEAEARAAALADVRARVEGLPAAPDAAEDCPHDPICADDADCEGGWWIEKHRVLAAIEEATR